MKSDSGQLALIDSRDMRAARMEQVAVLDKVGALTVLPDEVHATTDAVATFYGVPTATIRTVTQEHRSELEENGYRVVRGDELRKLRTEMENPSLFGRARAVALFTRRAVLNVGMLLRDSPVAERVRTYLLEVEELAPDELKKTAYQRLLEQVQHRELRDLIAENASDYAPSSKHTGWKFAEAQNLLYLSAVSMTAEQIKKSGRPIQTWSGKNGPTAHERRVAKNYLTEDELKKLVKRGALIMAHVNVRFEEGPKPTMDEFLDTIREVLGSLPATPAVGA